MEVDYTAYYAKTFESIGLDVELGFIYYEFPHAEAGNTQEIYAAFGWDDSILWRALGLDVKDPILNPSASIYFDIDNGGVWGEIGASHEFALAEYGCENTSILKDVTVGLNCSMGWANDWWLSADYDGPMTMQYGLDATLDLKSALGMQDEYCGGFYLKGFLNYNQALTNNDNAAMMSDTIWGGLTIGYEW